MSVVEIINSGLYWLLLVCVLYTYIIYPIMLWAITDISRISNTAKSKTNTLYKRISVLISAYNEEDVIESRVRNALEMDYPTDKIEIVVASDGSTDRTAEIVRGITDPRVRLIDYPIRRGKASVLNETISQIQSEIILLSDANTYTELNVAKMLVRWFENPDVGVVCGRLILTDSATGQNADGVYWKYETFLKKCESRLGALLGSNGAIYAIRRDIYVPIPSNTIVDDFVIPLLAKLKTNCQIIYDTDAIAHEETAPDIKGEFRRRARIGAGGFQAIVLLWRLLNPKYGWLAFAFFSHKVMRWLCPFFMIGMLITSGLLWNNVFYRTILLAQIAVYVGVILCGLIPALLQTHKLVRFLALFVNMNAALFVGFLRWVSGTQNSAWKRTARQVSLEKAS